MVIEGDTSGSPLLSNFMLRLNDSIKSGLSNDCVENSFTAARGRAESGEAKEECRPCLNLKMRVAILRLLLVDSLARSIRVASLFVGAGAESDAELVST